MNGSFRRFVSQLLIGTILFAQIAVAAYACPVLAKWSAASDPISSSSVAKPGDCDQMDDMMDATSPNLCSAHCHNHEQSADHAAAPALPPALFVALYWLVAPAITEPLIQTSEANVLHVALSPPHAILHCCFRI